MSNVLMEKPQINAILSMCMSCAYPVMWCYAKSQPWITHVLGYPNTCVWKTLTAHLSLYWVLLCFERSSKETSSATFRRSKPLKALSTKISGLLMFFKHMCNCRESPDFPSLFLSFHFQKHPPRGHQLGSSSRNV